MSSPTWHTSSSHRNIRVQFQLIYNTIQFDSQQTKIHQHNHKYLATKLTDRSRETCRPCPAMAGEVAPLCTPHVGATSSLPHRSLHAPAPHTRGRARPVIPCPSVEGCASHAPSPAASRAMVGMAAPVSLSRRLAPQPHTPLHRRNLLPKERGEIKMGKKEIR
jgi:hypothetical protein